ncbi:NAD-dependent epimerase/dehydratase family protein, partial [Salmonella enterica subsp. enterica serovar Typhimurium]|uniref:NAD-dependent epimerase/dehydratase family protein n=1 Tax=Salmonella enterica TaxID=28901 RepID=UPI0026317D44
FYGAFDGDDKFTSMVIRRCLSNQPVKLTSGLQQRDFLYIKDLLTAFDCIISNVNNFPKFHSIEVGSGEAISIREYVDTVNFYGAFDGDDKFTSMVIRRCLSNQPVKLTSGLQ